MGKKYLQFKIPLVLAFTLILVSVVFYLKSNLYKYNPVEETAQAEQKNLPPGLTGFRLLTESYRVPALIYHYVEYVTDHRDTIRKSLDITPNIFEAQVMTLRDNGYTFITAGELADIVDGFKDPPDKPVLLTFDDGYRDFYTDVFPILKKYRVKATVYIISGFIDKPNYMFKNQLTEILKSGLVEIGSHTVNHKWLTGKSRTEVIYEVTQSKNQLEKILGIKVVSFAYPYGSFDRSVIEIVKNAQYRSAASTIEGFDAGLGNKYFFYRIKPGNRVNAELISYLNQTTF